MRSCGTLSRLRDSGLPLLRRGSYFERSVFALECRERLELVFDRCQAGLDDRFDDLARRFIARSGLFDRDAVVGIDEDPGRAVFLFDLPSVQMLRRPTPREPAAGAVVDRIGAFDRTGKRPEDVAAIEIAPRDEDGMPRPLPTRTGERGMSRRKGAGRPFSVNQHLAEFRVDLALHQIMADLIEKLEPPAEYLLKRFTDGLEDHQAVDDREVCPGGNRVQIGAVVGRVGRKIPQIHMLDLGRTLGSGDVEIIGREPVPEAAAPGMDLHEERLGLQAALQLDEVVPPAEAPDLLDTALGFSPSAPRNFPVVVDG